MICFIKSDQKKITNAAANVSLESDYVAGSERVKGVSLTVPLVTVLFCTHYSTKIYEKKKLKQVFFKGETEYFSKLMVSIFLRLK